MPLRPETLKKYVEMAVPLLIEVAKGKRGDRFITYKQLMDEMGGPGRGFIGEVLEEVSDREYEGNRPLLSALVVHTVDGLPGDGFWELRVLPPSLKNASMREKIDFWEKEYRKCHEYWRMTDPIEEAKGMLKTKKPLAQVFERYKAEEERLEQEHIRRMP